MRIISQDKTRDIPYEECAIQIRNDNAVVAFNSEYCMELGKYNSQDDAKAVLWAIAAYYKTGGKYFEMPDADEDLSYAHREV